MSSSTTDTQKEFHKNLASREQSEAFLKMAFENENEGGGKKGTKRKEPDYESDGGSSVESDVDSDEEMVLRFFPKGGIGRGKGGVKGGVEPQLMGLTLSQSKKIGTLKAEVVRLEDRTRYLQLDLNTYQVKIDEGQEKITKLRESIRERNVILVRNKKTICNACLLRIYAVMCFFLGSTRMFRVVKNPTYVYFVDLNITLMMIVHLLYVMNDIKCVLKYTIPKIKTR